MGGTVYASSILGPLRVVQLVPFFSTIFLREPIKHQVGGTNRTSLALSVLWRKLCIRANGSLSRIPPWIPRNLATKMATKIPISINFIWWIPLYSSLTPHLHTNKKSQSYLLGIHTQSNSSTCPGWTAHMPLARQLLVGPNALAQPSVDLVSSLYLRPYDLAEAAQSHQLQIISKLNKHLY